VREIRTAILDCFERSDSGRAFKAALEEKGLVLANGDRRDCFVVIDQEGGHHALNKKLTGMTLAAIRERFADLDRSQLPGVEQAQEIQRHSQAERTQEQQAAPIWDRDAATRAADQRITDAAVAHSAQTPEETRKRPEPVAASMAQPEAAIPANSSTTAARETDAVPELARAADAAIDQTAHAGEGMLRGLGKLFASFVNWLADSIAPPPPPTRDQAERSARAAEERQEQRAFDQAEQQQRTLQEFLAAEIRRTQQAEAERDPRLAEMMNLHAHTSSRRRETEAERDRD
jgi:hypothetical protein